MPEVGRAGRGSMSTAQGSGRCSGAVPVEAMGRVGLAGRRLRRFRARGCVCVCWNSLSPTSLSTSDLRRFVAGRLWLAVATAVGGSGGSGAAVGGVLCVGGLHKRQSRFN